MQPPTASRLPAPRVLPLRLPQRWCRRRPRLSCSSPGAVGLTKAAAAAPNWHTLHILPQQRRHACALECPAAGAGRAGHCGGWRGSSRGGGGRVAVAAGGQLRIEAVGQRSGCILQRGRWQAGSGSWVLARARASGEACHYCPSLPPQARAPQVADHLRRPARPALDAMLGRDPALAGGAAVEVGVLRHRWSGQRWLCIDTHGGREEAR